MNRQPGKGKLWKAPLALERRSKLKSVNTNMMTETHSAMYENPLSTQTTS